MSFRVSHCGDVHIEEERYFGDTAQCLGGMSQTQFIATPTSLW